MVVIAAPLAAGLAVGGASALMGVLGASAQNRAEQEDYAAQVAFQNASTEFARWQAGFNKRITDANAQYNYWQETVNYNQQLAYSRSLRNYELLKAIAQADVVRDVRSAAGADYVRSSEAINQAAAEAATNDAVAFQQYQVAAIKARARVRSGDQEGGSIDRLISDYDRQVGDYQTIQSLNEGFRRRQYTREQAAAVAQYLSRYNSQPFYETQPYMEPVAPFAPLPALLAPSAPTMRGAPPSGAAGGLRIASGLLGGVQTGLSIANGLQPLAGAARPSKPAPGGN